MKRWIFYIALVIFLSSFAGEKRVYRELPNESFGTGERLEYRVHMGFVNAGYGVMQISDGVFQINGRPCYKVDVYGETTGLTKVFYDVKDNWGTYLDTAAIVPHRFYRYIKENRYRKNEIVDFEHKKDTAVVSKLDKQTKELREKRYYPIPSDVQDLISGYYYLRVLDFDKMPIGKVLSIDAFFDEELYDFKVRYLGKEKVNTKLGKFHGIVLAPIMPKNSLFRGEDAIKVWLSDDKNKIPLKVKASMFVGAIEVDITHYSNLKNPLNFAN